MTTTREWEHGLNPVRFRDAGIPLVGKKWGVMSILHAGRGRKCSPPKHARSHPTWARLPWVEHGATTLPRVILWLNTSSDTSRRQCRMMIVANGLRVLEQRPIVRDNGKEGTEWYEVPKEGLMRVLCSGLHMTPIVVAAPPDKLWRIVLMWPCVKNWEHFMSGVPAEHGASTAPKTHGQRVKPVLADRSDVQRKEERGVNRRHVGYKHFSEHKLCTIRTERDDIIADEVRRLRGSPPKPKEGKASGQVETVIYLPA